MEKELETQSNLVLLTSGRIYIEALSRYLKYILRIKNVYLAYLGNPSSVFELPEEVRNNGLWVIEAFNAKELNNPEGFRTAKKLARAGKRVLLLFTYVPDGFPEEGDFWLTLPWKTPLSKKIEQVLKSPPPSEEDFERLERLWPLLKYKPSNHHH